MVRGVEPIPAEPPAAPGADERQAISARREPATGS
jgi:hypothetical protein